MAGSCVVSHIWPKENGIETGKWDSFLGVGGSGWLWLENILEKSKLQ